MAELNLNDISSFETTEEKAFESGEELVVRFKETIERLISASGSYYVMYDEYISENQLDALGEYDSDLVKTKIRNKIRRAYRDEL